MHGNRCLFLSLSSLRTLQKLPKVKLHQIMLICRMERHHCIVDCTIDGKVC